MENKEAILKGVPFVTYYRDNHKYIEFRQDILLNHLASYSASQNEELQKAFENNKEQLMELATHARDLESTIDELKKENKQANEFICDVAKLFGEDDLGYDDKQWTIDDFKDAINSTIDEKNKEIERLGKLLDDIAKGERMLVNRTGTGKYTVVFKGGEDVKKYYENGF